MKTRFSVFGLAMLLLAAGAYGEMSSQDTQIAISPAVQRFPSAAVNSSTTPAIFTVSNLSAGALTNISATLSGEIGGDYAITATTCGSTLAAAAQCTVSVAFKPTVTGIRTALLLLASSSTSTPQLAAFLTNNAASSTNGDARIPPVRDGAGYFSDSGYWRGHSVKYSKSHGCGKSMAIRGRQHGVFACAV